MEIDILKHVERKISRGGEKMWNFLRSLKAGDCISGKIAMNIKDLYGIRPEDLVFFFTIINVEIKMEEFIKLLEEEKNKPKNRLC